MQLGDSSTSLNFARVLYWYQSSSSPVPEITPIGLCMDMRRDHTRLTQHPTETPSLTHAAGQALRFLYTFSALTLSIHQHMRHPSTAETCSHEDPVVIRDGAPAPEAANRIHENVSYSLFGTRTGLCAADAYHSNSVAAPL